MSGKEHLWDEKHKMFRDSNSSQMSNISPIPSELGIYVFLLIVWVLTQKKEGNLWQSCVTFYNHIYNWHQGKKLFFLISTSVFQHS